MMPQTPQADWEQIGRYLAGESTPEETAAVRRWLEEHPSDAAVIAALDRATQQLSPTQVVDTEAALRRVKTRMRATTPAISWRRYAAFAAAAAVVVAVGVLVARGLTPTPTQVASSRTYTTGVGERREVLLTDGTQVMLGPATTLRVSRRVAELDGEALFSVAHDPQHPFTVRARNATIRDIGTDFTVHSDPGEPVRVVVSAGVVMMSATENAAGARTDSVTLVRGDVGVLDENGKIAAGRGAATDDDLAWTLGRLVFRNASLAELAADLRRWYGVELRVTPSDSALLRRHFTGSFAKESANQVLDVIARALGARVERRGDTVYLRSTPSAK